MARPTEVWLRRWVRYLEYDLVCRLVGVIQHGKSLRTLVERNNVTDQRFKLLSPSANCRNELFPNTRAGMATHNHRFPVAECIRVNLRELRQPLDGAADIDVEREPLGRVEHLKMPAQSIAQRGFERFRTLAEQLFIRRRSQRFSG